MCPFGVRLGKGELVLVLFVRLFDLRLFGFVSFIFLLVSDEGEGGAGGGAGGQGGCGGHAGGAPVCDCGTTWTFYFYLFFLVYGLKQRKLIT